MYLVLCSNARKAECKACFALQNKNPACQFGYGVENRGRGFASCQQCQIPSRQIVSVSWGMEREALLWFGSTDQCQARRIGPVPRWESGGGSKDWRNLEYKWHWLPPLVVPMQTLLPETSYKQQRWCWGWRERCLISGLFWSLGAHYFRVTGTQLWRGTALSLLAMITLVTCKHLLPSAH